MPMQILTHTPLFVWAILAFLIFRGILSMRTRDVDLRRLFIIPVVMTALALQDIATRFGFGATAVTAWAVAAAGTALLVLAFTPTRIEAGTSARTSAATAAGSLRLRGSWMPLATMLAVFVTKYTAIVSMVMHPQLRQDAAFVAAVCAASGLCNGIFLGSLARDVKAGLALRGQTGGAVAA